MSANSRQAGRDGTEVDVINVVREDPRSAVRREEKTDIGPDPRRLLSDCCRTCERMMKVAHFEAMVVGNENFIMYSRNDFGHNTSLEA